MSSVCEKIIICYTFYMTIWHKRLLIFLGKIFGVIILILAIALFFYYHYYFKKDNLIKYVPQNAVLYSTFRLDNKLKDNQIIKNFLAQLKQDCNLPDFDLDSLNYMLAYNSALAIIPNQKNNELSFDYLVILDFNGRPDYAQPFIKYFQSQNWSAELLTNQALNKNVLLASNSKKVIARVKKIAVFQEPSLADKINVFLNLKDFNLSYLGKLYLNLDSIIENLNLIKDPRSKLLLLALKSENIKEIYLGLIEKDSKLILENIANEFNVDLNQPLLTNVPINTGLILNFNNGQEQFKKMYKFLAQDDPEYFYQLEKNKIMLESLYKFNLENDVLSFFTGPAQLMADSQNHYLLAVEATQITDLDSKLNKLEEIAKQYLASQNPVETQKNLPDYTTITQIVKQPEKYKFIINEINGIKIHSIRNNGLEFAYLLKDNVLILANSGQKLEDLVKNVNLEDINDYVTYLNENNANLSQNLLIKANYLQKLVPFLSFTNDLIMTEDLSGNGKFWLSLD